MKNKKQKMISILIGIAVIVVAVAAFMIEENIRRHTPSKKHIDEADIIEMFGVEDGRYCIVLNDCITDVKGWSLDESVYLEYNFVKENINSRFYWDDNEQILIYTTPTEIIKANLDEQKHSVNGTQEQTEYAIVKSDGTNTYINIDYVKRYSNMEYEQLTDPDRICITSNYGEEISYVVVQEATQVRLGDGIKQRIVADVQPGDELVLMPPEEEQEEDWLKVSVNGGFEGFVKRSKIGEEQVKVLTSEYREPVYDNISRDHAICMGWHMVTSEAANGTLWEAAGSARGLNVISPTWFRICDDEGNITSLADETYVQQAHEMGLEVWAMADDQSPDSRDSEVFPYTSRRENLEEQLLAEAVTYGLDGINIDFEYIQQDFAEDYVQFVREFSVKCRNAGLVFSIDNYVSMSYNSFYNRTEQGIVADYVVIMGYDEHNNSSSEAGSVASLKWVREGIENTLKEVPAAKTINAVPFYTRVWEENGENLSSRALGMEAARSEMESNQSASAWIEDFGQTYMEYTKDGIRYCCWLEDRASITEKAKLIPEYQLAGISAWRLGLETNDVWEAITEQIGG